MSTALIKAARLKPEVRLGLALSEFQADLSTQQKDEYTSHQRSASRAPLKIQDVMQITATIDRRNGAGHRCLGPRFTNFLEGIQQYAALGDIIVGGSQNLIACGVWSAVRLSLFAAVASSAYIARLSALFMEIGRSTPRLQSLGTLYPRSAQLRDHLCEYAIVVVELCHEILKYSKRSPVGKVSSSLNDSGLVAFRTKLEGWAATIRDDVSSLMAMSIEDERAESSRFRASVMKFSSKADHLEGERQKQRILRACSTYDHQTPWKQARKSGTTNAFRDQSEYQAWRSSKKPHSLLYTGILGSGKTVQLANIIDDLTLYIGTRQVPVAYFFCRHDIHTSLQARTVVGSLTRQILSATDSTADSCRTRDIEALANIDGLSKLLKCNIAHDQTIYCVVDGLDECAQGERDTIIKYLTGLQSAANVLICYSMRSESDYCYAPKSKNENLIKLVMPTNNPEISGFIQSKLESCLEDGRLHIGDPAIILDIKDALLSGAEGMFLWAALQIEVLCMMYTDHAIREALATLPKGLTETYTRILHMHREPRNDHYQQALMQLVYTARRPLTRDKVREALSVTPGDTLWNDAKLINDLSAIIKLCGPLLIVDEEEETIRFVHHSVKQFLNDAPTASTNSEFATQADLFMGRTVVTYLSYDIFGTQISKRPKFDMQMVASTVAASTLPLSLSKRMLAMSLLRSRETANVNIEQLMEYHGVGCQHEAEFHFMVYARDYGHWHILGLLDDNSSQAMLYRLIADGRLDIDALVTPHFRLPLSWKSMIDCVRGKLPSEDSSTQSDGKIMRSPTNECGPILKLLSFTKRIDVKTMWHHSPAGTKLFGKAEFAVLSMLLQSGVEVNSWNSYGDTLLSRAVRYGDTDLVSFLLNAGATVNRQETLGRSQLPWAASQGYDHIVGLLLEAGVDVNASDTQGKTALMHASAAGHDEITKMLLGAGADFTAKNADGNTALLYAADEFPFRAASWDCAEASSPPSKERVIRILLNAGADIEAKNRSGNTALAKASMWGEVEIVKLLLAAGADVETLNLDSKTPLILAEEGEHKNVVDVLRATIMEDWAKEYPRSTLRLVTRRT